MRFFDSSRRLSRLTRSFGSSTHSLTHDYFHCPRGLADLVLATRVLNLAATRNGRKRAPALKSDSTVSHLLQLTGITSFCVCTLFICRP